MNRAAVKKAIKDTMQLDPGLISNTEREKFIDDVIDDLGSLGVWQASALINAPPVVLPATFTSLINAYWNGRRLTRTDSFNVPAAIPTGEPVYVWLEGAKLLTYPTIGSAGVLKLEFISKGIVIPTDAVGTGTDLDDLTVYGVPVEWHRLVADGATAKAHRKNGNYLSAREYQGEYDKAKERQYVAALEKFNETRRQNDESYRPSIGADIFIPPGWGV